MTRPFPEMAVHDEDARMSDPDVAVSPIFIVCSCGKAITRAEWAALPSLGTMPSEFDSHDLLLKNCPHCSSTRAEFVEKVTAQ